jgi:SAM-dependent methyltransferase
MFAPEILEPAVDRLGRTADEGRALEFAIGTGRVAIPLARRGVPVTGIELSGPMIGQLRTRADATAIPVIAGDMATARALACTRSSIWSITRPHVCSPRASKQPASATPPGT